MGIHSLVESGAIIDFSVDNQSLKWLAISWALHQAMPGVIFAAYAFMHHASKPACPVRLSSWKS